MPKRIFISGASEGIGFHIAKKFYEEGFEVAICSRNAEKLKKVKVLLPKIHTYVCDISQKESVKELAETLNKEFSPLDVLVNNGGTFLPGLIHAEEDAVFENLMRTNVDSAYYLTKGLIGQMMERKSGTIVNMCSIASLMAYPNGGSYGISKFALLGFSKALRQEMKEYNVRVISIMPGAVKTASWDGVDIPEDRFIPPEDIASITWNAYQMSGRTVIEDIVVRPTPGDI